MRPRARSLVAAPLGLLGYDLLRKSYYSPVPDVAQLDPDVFERPKPMPGVNYELDRWLAFLKGELAPFLAEYRPPEQSNGDPRSYHLANTLYGPIDASILYAMVRRFAPRRVLELGSGMSSLVIADAREQSRLSADSRHIICDPFPRADLKSALSSVAELRAVSATAVHDEEFAALGAGDLLFVDTTHTVKIGGEVNRLILEVLPRLAPGVIVHVHDIYLPWEYPRDFIVERRFFWAEQYLLQAFLAFNTEFEVLIGAHALARERLGELTRLLPSTAGISPASAMWLRRAGGDSPEPA